MKKMGKKILSFSLSLIMVLCIFPVSVFAANDYTINSTESTDDYYNLISKIDRDIAPGITESEIVLNSDDGSRRQVLFIMEANLNNEYVKVINSYNDTKAEYGNYKTGVMSAQAALAESQGYNVVGAMNTCLSWYTGYETNRVGEPLGFIMVDAKIFFDPANCGYTYGKVGFPTVLVINKDFDENGNPRPSNIPKVEMPQILSAADLDGWEDQVIPTSSGYIVKDGKNVYSTPNHKTDNTNSAPRSVVGIKPDGTVVIMVNDGRQSPYSAGMSMYELAEVMLDLGCTFAVNCDGGGSTTYLSQRPGEELKVNNSPSDGSERPTTTGILFVSTAPADGTFARANISSDDAYYVPGSTVKFDVLGTDLVGTATEIPDDAYWQIKEDGMGSIEDGVFVSNGTVGTVTAQMVYDDKVVGEHSIEIIVPTGFEFASKVMTVPFESEVAIKLKATINDGVNSVAFGENDITLSTTNAALGTFNGLSFTSVSLADAPADLTSILTATLKCNESLVATAKLNLGKASEVLFDFEDASDVDYWNIEDVNGNNEGFVQELSHATQANGQVHDGNGSMKLHLNPIAGTGISSGGWAQSELYPNETKVISNAQSLGFWLYIPEDFVHLQLKIHYYFDKDGDGDYDTKNRPTVLDGTYKIFDESGWHYFSVDISAYNSIMIPGKEDNGLWDSSITKNILAYRFVEFNMPHANGSEFVKEYGSINGPYTLYIDNITADYSEAADDRAAPIFGAMNLNGDNDVKIELKSHEYVTTTNNILSLIAKVQEDTTKTNATGLNASTAKAYVDGKEVDVTFNNGNMSISNIVVADGMHRIKFEICDNMGNKSSIVRMVYVDNGSDMPTVQVVPADTTLDRLYGGSIYWMNINATDIETVKSVTTVIDLNNVNHWELDHMEIADGFAAEYYVNAETNTAYITITRIGDNDQEGEATLASLPIRVIYFDTDIKTPGYTAETYWNGNYNFWAQDVKVDVDMGIITFIDGTIGTFSNEEFSVDTEMYMARQFMDTKFLAERGTCHVHSAEAMVDKAATCDADGYTGRTYCDVCDSIVDWGTTIVATGHDYELVDGVMKCTCGDLFNGELNGVTYVDGVAIKGWFGEEYYIDGVKLYGVHIIDGKYYNFGENGVCSGKYPMTAEWWTNEKGESFYLNAGVPTAQYALINSVPTYFSKEGVAFQGEIEINGEICVFEKGVFVESTTADVLLAGRVGPDALFVFYADGTFVLCGEGGTYDFVSVGTTTLPKLSWKNRPWGKNTDLSNGIKKIVIGNGITYIGDYLFYQCYNVESIEFEENSNLVEIGRVPFNYLPKLKEVTLPESLRTIGNQAFGYNAKLEKVVVPQKIAYIQYNAFSNSGKVVLDVVKGTYAEEFAEKNNVPYTTRAFVEGLVAEGTFGDNLTWSFFESGKLVIGGTGAMPDFNSRNDQPWAEYRDDVTSIVIGKDITYLGKYAFAYAYSVKAVTFEEGSKLERIGPAALYYLSALTEITLPETVVRIDNLGLAYNGKLASVYVPQKIAYIQYNAFNNSSKVVLNVAEGTYAEEFAEKNNIAYTTRAFVEGVIAEGTFGDNLTWSFLESGKLVIGGTGAMPDFNGRNDQPWAEYRDDVTSIVIGKDITYLGKYAFAYAYSVKSVTFEEGSKLERIGPAALYYLSALTEITLPETVVRIDNLGLAYNGKLASVYVPQKIAYIQYNAFNNSSKVVLNVAEGTYAEEFAEKNNIDYTTRAFVEGVIAEGTFGDNLTWTLFESGKLVIGGTGAMPDFNGRNDQPWAEYRDDVTSIVIGKDITSLGKYAFAYAYSVKSVTFEEGSKLEKIGAAALYYLSALTEITLPETVVRIDNLGLAYNGKLASVYVPAGIEYIQYNAFNNSNNVVLNVVEGSYAETFAVKYDLDYTKR